MFSQQINSFHPNKRINIWFGIIVVIVLVFVLRLFYLQVIKHDYYKNVARQAQTKEYELPAERGLIFARDGKTEVPIVLNETRYTLFADPGYINDPKSVAQDVASAIGGSAKEYEKEMRADSRYAVLKKQITKKDKEKIDALNHKGIGTKDVSYRTYPQGNLAAQVLGFVNDDGVGKYGVEQYLNDKLSGEPGQLKAITDASGVPLAANEDNIVTQPKAGDRVVLTLDVSMQKQLQDILKAGLQRANSDSGSAIIMDANTGAVKAMANYPTYNPSDYFKVSDANLFTNPSVSAPLEVGSVMKPLTMAAALNSGSVNTGFTYNDSGTVDIDGTKITNIENFGGGTRGLKDILQLSLNTGAVSLLKAMGGGEVNLRARKTWHDYMNNYYHFGKPTGIEQGYESAGIIPDPINGYGLNVQFANTAFGQGMSATPLQMGSALSSVINGGKYYKPFLVDKIDSKNGDVKHTKSTLLASKTVSVATSKIIRGLMQNVVNKNWTIYGMSRPNPSYNIGGKTGTAQITKPGGGYYKDRFNGMFTGFIGGNKPQYVIIVRVNNPRVAGYAGSQAAGPVFGRIIDMLINNFGVTPKTN